MKRLFLNPAKIFISLLLVSSISALGCRENYRIAKTAFDDYFTREELKPVDDLISLPSARPLACRFNEATAQEVELLLNSIQKDYRVYFRESAAPSDEDSSPAVNKYSFVVDGALPAELSRFAILYNLGFKVSSGSIFLFRGQEFPEDVFVFNRHFEKDEVDSLSSVFRDLQLNQIRNRLYVRGRIDRVSELVDVLPSSDDQEQFVLSLVLLNVDSSKVFDLAAKLNFSTLDLISANYSLYDVFQAYGNIDLNSSNGRNYFEQQLYLSLGQLATYNFGNEIQREERAISDQGTSTVNGYRNFKDGVEIVAKIDREEDSLIVDLTFDRSKFTDSTALARSSNQIKYERLKVKPNHLYYLTQFVEDSSSAGLEFLRGFNQASSRSVLVWFAVFPVSEKNFEKIPKQS